MKRLLIISVICLVGVGCGGKNTPEGQPVNQNVDFGVSDYKKITSTNNMLGFNMLEHVEPDDLGNIFISPTSLLMATLMVYNGADGTTKSEIETALELEDVDGDEINKASASLLSMLDKDTDDISIQLANSIWVSDTFHLQDTFKDVNKHYLHADVHSMDISDNKSADKINNWVQKSTNDKITDIVEAPLNQDIVAILLNAVYFNGDWTYPFDPNETTEKAFYSSDGNASNVKMMTLHEDELVYMENDIFQAVSLPYGDKEMSMKIFLPKDDDGLDSFTKGLTNDNWQDWLNTFREEEGTIQLPQFELDYEITLNQTMKSLGIKTAFTKDAEFPKIIQEDDPIMISKVKQKTFIKVDETGTEAAGATSVEMQTTSAPIDGPFSMIVNKPFCIAITDDETDTILFLGEITNPVE